MELNPEQQRAVDSREGAWCCLATAGSGKTTVLTKRIEALLREGARHSDILALTFTAEAATNMATRLGLKVPKTERYGFRTFHSFGLRLVQDESRFLPFGLSENPFP